MIERETIVAHQTLANQMLTQIRGSKAEALRSALQTVIMFGDEILELMDQAEEEVGFAESSLQRITVNLATSNDPLSFEGQAMVDGSFLVIHADNEIVMYPSRIVESALIVQIEEEEEEGYEEDDE